jgi:hypothetical protein
VGGGDGEASESEWVLMPIRFALSLTRRTRGWGSKEAEREGGMYLSIRLVSLAVPHVNIDVENAV